MSLSFSLFLSAAERRHFAAAFSCRASYLTSAQAATAPAKEAIRHTGMA